MKTTTQIDVLWLVEHVAREMDVACAVKCLAEGRHGLRFAVEHVYEHGHDLMRTYAPRIIAMPFFYGVEYLAVEEYVARWPETQFFNVAWEQIFYKGHLGLKRPSDDFARQKVAHHAWGAFYADYLRASGVDPEQVWVNGNPVYQLYLDPYRSFYADRATLASRYALDPGKRWILIPENYRWAFIQDYTIVGRERAGANGDELRAMRRFAASSLARLLSWCNELAKKHDVEMILRPKPATMLQEMEDFYRERVGNERASGLHFIKDESIREWILAGDVVTSAFSTTLIEAAIAGKAVFMVEPLPTIEAFDADWYQLLPRVGAQGDFEARCVGSTASDGVPLAQWAHAEMLANGDPISGLADRLARLTVELRRGRRTFWGAREWVRSMGARRMKRKDYFNERTHEDDRFSAKDVADRTGRWRRILLREGAESA